MNYINKQLVMDQNIIFFNVNVQRQVAFLYGISIKNGIANIVKYPYGVCSTNNINSFKKFIDIKDFNQKEIYDIGWNTLKLNTCKCYFIGKNIGTNYEIRFKAAGLGSVPTWTSNFNNCTYYFSQHDSVAQAFGGQTGKVDVNIDSIMSEGINFPSGRY